MMENKLVSIMATLGFFSGIGFGIYTAVENFNIEHQSANMAESTRFFAEFLQQSGNVLIQGLMLGLYSLLFAVCGVVIECCKRLGEKRTELIDVNTSAPTSSPTTSLIK